jgi:radical SAM superfamily enzyme YgiQ (UPF0313 family)
MQVILFTDVAGTDGYGKYAGTYKIATEIRIAGYTCQVIDLFSKFSYNELEKIIDKFVTSETILIGFSCTLMEKRVVESSNKNDPKVYNANKVYNFGRPNNEVSSLMSYAKSKNSKLKTVAGGARINETSNWPFIDFTVMNKGEVAIIKLIEHIIYNTDLPNSKLIGNTILIDGNDLEYSYNQELFSKSKIIYQPQDIILPNESLPIEVSRGCIFKCAYCRFDLIGKKIGDWQKSVETLKDELIRNYELYGTTDYSVSDELINESMPKMELVHEAFSTLPFKVNYTSYARLDLLHAYPTQRELLVESGAIGLTFGIETLHELAGKKIGKGLGPTRIKQTLSYCNETWKDKIIMSSNFIVGLPEEPEESVRATADWVASDDCPLDLVGFIPLMVRPKSDGRIESKMDKDPKKYKLEVFEDRSWQGEYMNFAQARDLTFELLSDPRLKSKVKFGSSMWLGRIMNLGYTKEEIFNIIKDKNIDKDFLKNEIDKRSNFIKNLYYQKLMEI